MNPQRVARLKNTLVAIVGVFWAALLCQLAGAQEDTAAGFKFLEVKVLDPDGQPLRDVEVEINLDGTRFPMPVDDQGMVSLNVPAGEDNWVSLTVKHDGYVAVGVAWKKGEAVPEEFTIPLRKAVSIGGVVHDEDGNPVEGVKVEGSVIRGTGEVSLPGKGQLIPYFYGELATTDAAGRWQTNTAPSELIRLRLDFSHSDYIPSRGYDYQNDRWEELRSLDNVVVLKKGLEITGRVFDPNGAPVAGAKVAVGNSRYSSNRQMVTTDPAGEYRLTKLTAGPTVLTVSSPDWAPDMHTVTAKRDAEPADFQLEPPQTVRLRVVDPDGEPIEGVIIVPEEWRGHRALEDPFGRKTTNAEGVWEWNAAPADEIQYSIFGQGRFSVPDWQARFSASDEIQDVTMLPAVVVTGKVVDKETGLPIERFRYVEGVWWEPRYTRYILQRSNGGNVGRNGSLRFVMEDGCEKFMIRVEADGYRPANSREIFPNEGNLTIDFDLEEGSGPTGVVKLPEGGPAQGVDVAMATAGQHVQIRRGQLESDLSGPSTTTDAEGHFELPFPEGDYAVVCLHDAGSVVVYADDDERELEVTLQPWGRVEGVAMRGKELLDDEAISLFPKQPRDFRAPRISWSYYTRTDENGRFTFERVNSGPATVCRRVPYARVGDSGMLANTHTVEVDVRPGESLEVQLGGTGRKVVGKLTIPSDDDGKVAWHMGMVSLTEQRHPLGVPGFFHQVGQVLGKASAWGTKKSTPTTNTPPQRSYAAAISDEGGFEIHDVPAGTYQLAVKLYAVPNGGQRNWNPIGSLNISVEIAAASEEDHGPVDIGHHELQMTSSSPTQRAAAWSTFLSN